MSENNSDGTLELKIDKLKDNLLDLSEANPFLNFIWDDLSIPIIDVDYFDLFSKFVLERKVYKFSPEMELDELKNLLENDDSTDRFKKDGLIKNIKRIEEFKDSKDKIEYYSQNTLSLFKIPDYYIERDEDILKAPLHQSELDMRLHNIILKNKKSVEKEGLANLFLALAYVEFDGMFAPLVFLPVSLKKTYDDYEISFNDYQNIKLNTSLKLKLEEKDINLPNGQIKTEMDLINYLTKVHAVCSGIGGIKPLISLGLFDFSNVSLYEDLDFSNLSNESKEELDQIFSEKTEKKENLVKVEDIDSINEASMYNVYDADSSQISVIEEAKLGDDLVVDTLCGTNKSETIINLIANLLANKMTVLYVSDKIDAIKEIQNKLDDLELGFSYLDLYADNYDSSKLMDEIFKSINYPFDDLNMDSKYFNVKVEKSNGFKSKLSSHFRFINAPYKKTGFTPYDLIGLKESNLMRLGKTLDLTKGDIKILRMKNLASLNENQISELVANIETISKIYKERIAPVSKHKFNNANTANLTDDEFLNLTDIIPELKKTINDLIDLTNKMNEKYGIKKLEILKDYDSYFENLEIIGHNPQIMGDDYELLNDYIHALESYQIKIEEYGSIEELESLLINESNQSKEDLKAHMEELNKLNEAIDNFNNSIKSLDEKLSFAGIRKLNSLDEISSALGNLKILTQNPSLVNDESELNQFINDMETFQTKNSENTPSDLLKIINEDTIKILDNSNEKLAKLISYKDHFQRIQDLIDEFNSLKAEIGLGKLNSIADIENSIEKCDLLLEKPVLITGDDDLNQFYNDFKKGKDKYSELPFMDYYNSMNNELNSIQNQIADELSESSRLEPKLLSIKNELKIVKDDLDSLFKKLSMRNVLFLKDIDEVLDNVQFLLKDLNPIDDDEREEINAYIQLIIDVQNNEKYTRYSLFEIEKLIEDIIAIKKKLGEYGLKESVFELDLKQEYYEYLGYYKSLNQSPILIKSENKRTESKYALSEFEKATEGGFFRKLISSSEKYRGQLLENYRAPGRISDDKIIRDYNNYFHIVRILKQKGNLLAQHSTNSKKKFSSDFEKVLKIYSDLYDLRVEYAKTKNSISKYLPEKDFSNALEELVLIKLKLTEIQDMSNMDKKLSKHFPNSYKRFKTNLDDLYVEYSELEKFSKMDESKFFKEGSQSKINFFRGNMLDDELDKIRHQKSKIYYYITLINNNFDLNGTILEKSKVYDVEIAELVEYCEKLYSQIKMSNDYFDKSIENYELSDLDLMKENFDKVNSFEEMKFLADFSKYEEKLNQLQEDYSLLLEYSNTEKNSNDLINRYYSDIWNGSETSLDDMARRNKLCEEFTELNQSNFFDDNVLKFLENHSDVIENKISQLKDIANKLSEEILSLDQELIFYNNIVPYSSENDSSLFDKNSLSSIDFEKLEIENGKALEAIKLLEDYQSKLGSYDKQNLINLESEIELNSISHINDINGYLEKLFNDSDILQYDISFDEEYGDLNNNKDTCNKFNEMVELRDSINSREDIINNHFYCKKEEFNLWNGPLSQINSLKDKIRLDNEFTELYNESFFSDKTIDLIKENPNAFNDYLSEITEEYDVLKNAISHLLEFNYIEQKEPKLNELEFNLIEDKLREVKEDLDGVSKQYSNIKHFKESKGKSKGVVRFDINAVSDNIEILEKILGDDFINSVNVNLSTLRNRQNSLNKNSKYLEELYALKNDFDQISIDSRYFKHIDKGYESSVIELGEQVKINRKYENLHNEGFFSEKTLDVVESKKDLMKLEELSNKEKQYVEFIIPNLDLIDSIYEKDKSYLGKDISELSDQINFLDENIGDLKNWQSFQTCCKDFDNDASSDYIKSLNNDEIDTNALLETFKYNFATNLLNEIKSDDLTLDTKDITELNDLEKEIIELNKLRVLESIKDNKPDFSNVDTPEKREQYAAYSKLNDELLIKKSSIKDILENTIDYVKLFKPIFIMNPVSVAEYLDSSKFESYFDYVIFDDISNTKIESSLSSLIRGKTKIIFSNSKFSSEMSIYDLCQTKFKKKSLNWNYEYLDESLIGFSNKSYYEDSLIIHPKAYESEDLGLKINYNKNGKFDSKSLTNKSEAKKIVDYAISHFKEFPNKSLGIIAFTKEQKDLIKETLVKKLDKYPELLDYFNPLNSFYIKDISEIYEIRDVTLISFTYGFDENKKLNLNYNSNNEYLLNSLLTRSLEKTVIFGNFKLKDLEVEMDSNEEISDDGNPILTNSNDLIKLKELLDYVENGFEAKDSGLSLFAESIYEFLIENGLNVKKQIGSKYNSNNAIDLVVFDDENYENPVIAIECDGDNIRKFKVLKDREVIHKNELSRLGWSYYHIYTSDWHNNRDESKERLLKAIQEAKVQKNSIDNEDIDSEDIIIDDSEDIEIIDDVEIDSDEIEIIDDVEIVLDDEDIVIDEDIVLDDTIIIDEYIEISDEKDISLEDLKVLL